MCLFKNDSCLSILSDVIKIFALSAREQHCFSPQYVCPCNRFAIDTHIFALRVQDHVVTDWVRYRRNYVSNRERNDMFLEITVK